MSYGVKYVRQREIAYDIAYMQNLKNSTNGLIYKNGNELLDLENEFMVTWQRVDSLEKTDAGRDWGQEKKGMTEDEMAGWHH